MNTSSLNQKIELWGMLDTENVLGELDREESKIKDVWAKITFKQGKASNVGNTQVEEVETDIIIRCRKLSIKEPKIDMFFMKNNIKYEVISFLEDFTNNSFWEFKCKVIYE